MNWVRVKTSMLAAGLLLMARRTSTRKRRPLPQSSRLPQLSVVKTTSLPAEAIPTPLGCICIWFAWLSKRDAF